MSSSENLPRNCGSKESKYAFFRMGLNSLHKHTYIARQLFENVCTELAGKKVVSCINVNAVTAKYGACMP